MPRGERRTRESRPSGRAGLRRPRGVDWIGHAGLAVSRPGGAPDRLALARALRIRPEWLELDVCVAADGTLVLHHDIRLTSGPPVSALDVAALRRAHPDLLTLDEGVEQLAGRLRLLIDIKTDRAAGPLGRWLAAQRDVSGFAVCTESTPALGEVGDRDRRVAIWRSLPNVGTRLSHHAGSVIVALWSHRHPTSAARMALDVGSAIRRGVRDPYDGAVLLGGVPWRRRLPGQIRMLAAEVRASGLCVHHWLITPELVAAARRLGIPVVAWTVNHPLMVRRVIRCGVDLVTTDEVEALRAAVTEDVIPRARVAAMATHNA